MVSSQPGTALPVLRSGAAVVFALLLVWAPYPQGLYTDPAQFVAFWQAGLALVGVLAMGFVERSRLAATPLRLAALLLWLTYLAAIAVAIAPRQAIQEAYKFGLFLMVLVVVSELVRSAESAPATEPAQPKRDVSRGRGRRSGASGRPDLGLLARLSGLATSHGIALVLWGSVAIFALVNLLAAVGLLALSEVVEGGRLYTTIRYPNSAAGLLGAAALLGLGVRHSARPSGGVRAALGAMAFGAGQWLLLTAFLATASRGAWLVFPVALLVLVAVWPGGRRLDVMADVAVSGVVAAASAALLARSYGQPLAGAAVLLAGLALGTGAGWLARTFAGLAPRLKTALVAVAAALVVIVPLFVLQVGLVPAEIRGHLVFSLSEESASDRIIWTQDALAIAMDHPVLGVGGGGWASIYLQYQSYPYFTNEVHNDFAEIWAESGTVGFSLLLALLGSGLWTSWQLLRRTESTPAPLEPARDQNPARRALIGGIGASATMLVLHSALDIDLSVAALGVFLWAILGLLDGLCLAGRPAAPTTVRWPRIVIAAALSVPTALSIGLFAAHQLGDRAIELTNAGRVGAAHPVIVRATELDPWARPLRINRALIAENLYTTTGRPEYLAEAWTQAAAAVETEPESPVPHNFRGALALRNGDYELAVAEYRTARLVHPYGVAHYENEARARVMLGLGTLGTDLETAREEFEAAADLLQLLAAQASRVPAYAEDDAIPSITPPLALHAGKARAMLGDLAGGVSLLEFAHAQPAWSGGSESPQEVVARKLEAALWLSAALELLRETGSAQAYLVEAESRFPDAPAARQQILSYLNLASAGN